MKRFNPLSLLKKLSCKRFFIEIKVGEIIENSVSITTIPDTSDFPRPVLPVGGAVRDFLSAEWGLQHHSTNHDPDITRRAVGRSDDSDALTLLVLGGETSLFDRLDRTDGVQSVHRIGRVRQGMAELPGSAKKSERERPLHLIR